MIAKTDRLLACLALALLAAQYTAAANAEVSAGSGTRGLVTTAACPLTCEELRVPKDSCRTWQSGNDCSVEDLSQAPGHRTLFRVPNSMPVGYPSQAVNQRTPEGTLVNLSEAQGKAQLNSRGLVTTAACPYSCRQARLPKDACREWQEGGLCHVEDLSQPPGHRSMFRVP